MVTLYLKRIAKGIEILGAVVRIERGASKEKGFQCDVSLADIPLSAGEGPDGDFYSVGNRIYQIFLIF